MWRVWRLKFGWENLCPILFADPFGFIVVMTRATQPVTREEIEAEDPDLLPCITSETNPESYGRVNGRVVSVDYALPDADDVAQQRAYYARTERR